MKVANNMILIHQFYRKTSYAFIGLNILYKFTILGSGPEGWLTSLPFLPLHWFVYSTGSTGTYSWTESNNSFSGQALAHQEKNWGDSFPPGWVCQKLIGVLSKTHDFSFARSGHRG